MILLFLIYSSKFTSSSGWPNFFLRASIVSLSSCYTLTFPNFCALFFRVSSSYIVPPTLPNFIFLFSKASGSSISPGFPNFLNLSSLNWINIGLLLIISLSRYSHQLRISFFSLPIALLGFWRVKVTAIFSWALALIFELQPKEMKFFLEAWFVEVEVVKLARPHFFVKVLPLIF